MTADQAYYGCAEKAWGGKIGGMRGLSALVAGLLAAGVLHALPAAAHPTPFSYLDVRLDGASLSGTLVLHDFDVAHDLGLAQDDLLDPAVVSGKRDALASLLAERLRFHADGQRVRWEIAAARPVADRSGVELTWRAPATRIGKLAIRAVLFPYDPAHQTFVNIYEQGALVRQEVVGAGHPAMEFYSRTRQGT